MQEKYPSRGEMNLSFPTCQINRPDYNTSSILEDILQCIEHVKNYQTKECHLDISYTIFLLIVFTALLNFNTVKDFMPFGNLLYHCINWYMGDFSYLLVLW